MVAFTKHAVHGMNKLVEVLLKAAIIHQQIVTRDVSVRTEQFNMIMNAFASMIAHARCEARHSKPDEKSKKTVISANVKRVFGSAQMKHVVHGVQPLAIRIIKVLMENVSILWENVHIIY